MGAGSSGSAGGGSPGIPATSSQAPASMGGKGGMPGGGQAAGAPGAGPSPPSPQQNTGNTSSYSRFEPQANGASGVPPWMQSPGSAAYRAWSGDNNASPQPPQNNAPNPGNWDSRGGQAESRSDLFSHQQPQQTLGQQQFQQALGQEGQHQFQQALGQEGHQQFQQAPGQQGALGHGALGMMGSMMGNLSQTQNGSQSSNGPENTAPTQSSTQAPASMGGKGGMMAGTPSYAQTAETPSYAQGGYVTPQYASGGHVAAQHLQEAGRGGDTMLVHMTPHEVGGLQALAHAAGGSLTINPHTGLPEAGFLSSILPIIAGVAGQMIGIPMPLTMALVGGGTGIATGSLTKGLMAGLSAMGGASMASALAPAAAGATTALSTVPTALSGVTPTITATPAVFPTGLSMAAGSGAGLNAIPGVLSAGGSGAFPGVLSAGGSGAFPGVLSAGGSGALPGVLPAGGSGLAGLGATNISNLAIDPILKQSMQQAAGAGAAQAAGPLSTFSKFGHSFADAAHAGMPGFVPRSLTTGAAAIGLAQPLLQTPAGLPVPTDPYASNYKGPYMATPRTVRRPTGDMGPGEFQWFDQVNPYPNVVTAESLGTAPAEGMARGGMYIKDGSFIVDARTVSEMGNGSSRAGQDLLARHGGVPIHGPGDGVSDSIHANIGGTQEARVARDEVKFAPEAVARIGGGDQKKGAQKLYALMDRAQKARKRAGRGSDTKLRGLLSA